VPTHYQVLGVPESASEDEVRQAYRRLAKAAHPDVAGDAEQFRRIAEAYDVLTDPVQRAAYDRGLQPRWVAAPPRRRRRRHTGRYALAMVAALVLAGALALVAATMRQSVGDDCLVGTWEGEAFEVPFRGVLDGREISAPIRGGAGVRLTVHADGRVRVEYGNAAPLTGVAGAYRIEGVYEGTSIERWEADDGRVSTRSDAAGVRFSATLNGRPPDQPLAVTVLDGEYPYTCLPATLELGPYRYRRTAASPRAIGHWAAIDAPS
jgi:curved DNA-binding protein CbpA